MKIRENFKSNKYKDNGTGGYGSQGKGLPAKRRVDEILTIVVHTTGGAKGSLFEREENFLLHSRQVSAHFLIGKQGQVVQLLPIDYIAWHTGAVRAYQFGNYNSIGIECHLTTGEAWTPEMKMALSKLTEYLLLSIPTIRHIVSHRDIAIPPGRKNDPLYFPESEFRAWAAKMLSRSAITLIGSADIQHDKVVNYIMNNGNNQYDEKTINFIITTYISLCSLSGVNPAVAIGQMILETGALSSFWSFVPRRNFAGIGVTGEKSIVRPTDLRGRCNGVCEDWSFNEFTAMWEKGISFDSVEEAVTAHIGRLVAYSVPTEQRNAFQKAIAEKALRYRALPSSIEGKVSHLLQLSGTWAQDREYHEKIGAIIARIS